MESIGATGPVALPATELVKQLRDGKAVFSTNFGQYLRREAKPFEAPIIMRTDPVEDVEAMVSKLQQQHPEACKTIAAPINNIYDYFDHYDVQLHGTAIIHAVLSTIAVQNSSTAMRVQQFTEDWKNRNFERFNEITADSQDLFTVEEKETYDEEFLKDAAVYLQNLRLGIPLMVSEAANGHTYSTAHLSTLTTNPDQHSLGPPTSGYMTMLSMQQVPSVPFSAPPTNPIHPAHPVFERPNSATMDSSGALVLPLALSKHHSDTELRNITPSYVPVARYGQDQTPRYHSHPTVLMEHEHSRFPRDIKDTHPLRNIPFRVRDASQSTYQPAQENTSFDKVQYRQPRKAFLKYGSRQPVSASGYAQNIGPVPHRSQVGFNAQNVHQFSGAAGSFPYQATEPLQFGPQVMGSQTSKQPGGYMHPRPSIAQDSQRPPSGEQYQNQHQGYEGLVPFPGGAMIGGALPVPNHGQESLQLIIPKTRGTQIHDVNRLRISPQEGYRWPTFQGPPFIGPASDFQGIQHREQNQGRPEDIVQSQGAPHFRIAPHNGFHGRPFSGSQPFQNQNQVRNQPDMVRYRHPRMDFSNDARVLEHHDSQQRKSSWDESKDILRYQENLQSSRGGLRRNSRGRGSRRPSSAQHAQPYRVQNHHAQDGFPDSDSVRGRNSAEYFGNISTNLDNDLSHQRDSNSHGLPTGTADYKAVGADKENVVGAGNELQRLQDADKMALEYINHDAGRFTNYHASHTTYRSQQAQPDGTLGAAPEQHGRSGPQRLYVGGQTSDQVDLYKLFAPFGDVSDIVGPIIPKNSCEKIPPFKFSFVTLQSPRAAERAQLSLDNTPINSSGFRWTVRYAYDRREKTDSGSSSQPVPYQYKNSSSMEHKMNSKTGGMESVQHHGLSIKLTSDFVNGTREQEHQVPREHESQTNAPLTPKFRGEDNVQAAEELDGNHSSFKTAKKGQSKKRKPSQLSNESTPTCKGKNLTPERGVSQPLKDGNGFGSVYGRDSQDPMSLTESKQTNDKTEGKKTGQERHATPKAESHKQQIEAEVKMAEIGREEHATPKTQTRKQPTRDREEKTRHEKQVTPKSKPQKHQASRRGSGKKNESTVVDESPIDAVGLGDAFAVSRSPENLSRTSSVANYHQQLVSNGSPTKKPKKQGTLPKPKQNHTQVAITVISPVEGLPEDTTRMQTSSFDPLDTHPDAWPALIKSPVAPSTLVAVPLQSSLVGLSRRASPIKETPKKQNTENSLEPTKQTNIKAKDAARAQTQEKFDVVQSPSVLLPNMETQSVSHQVSEKETQTGEYQRLKSTTSQISSQYAAELEPLSPITLVAISVSSVSPVDGQVSWAKEGEKQDDMVHPGTSALDATKKLDFNEPEESALASHVKKEQVDVSDSEEDHVYIPTSDISGIPKSSHPGSPHQELPTKSSYSALAKAETPRDTLPAVTIKSKLVASSISSVKEGDLEEGFAKKTMENEDEPLELVKMTLEDSPKSISPRANRKALTIEPTPWVPSSSSPSAHLASELNMPLGPKTKLRQDTNIKSCSLSIPSPPISTHMKKQRARTPTKERFAKEPKATKDTHVKASNIETSLSRDLKEGDAITIASTRESSAFAPVSARDGEVAARSDSEKPPISGTTELSVHDSDRNSPSTDEIRIYPSIDKANAVEDLFVPAPHQHRFQIISISLPTQSIEESISQEIRSAPLQITAPESPPTTTTTKKNHKKSKKKSKSRQTSSEISMTPPPVKIIEAFRPLTPPEDVPVPKSDDEKFPTLEPCPKESPSTPSLKALLNEQGVSRPPTPPKDLAPLNSDNEKQAVTSEASTEVSTLKGSPEGSPKGTLK
ncbi:MAG: hypothetical protein Q9187_006471, partial [Circinaria calcarea]